MKLTAKDRNGNTVVVCGRCGALTRPQKPSHVNTYLKASCKACSHSQTLLKAKGSKTSTASKLSKKYGLSAGG